MALKPHAKSDVVAIADDLKSVLDKLSVVIASWPDGESFDLETAKAAAYIAFLKNGWAEKLLRQAAVAFERHLEQKRGWSRRIVYEQNDDGTVDRVRLKVHPDGTREPVRVRVTDEELARLMAQNVGIKHRIPDDLAKEAKQRRASKKKPRG